MSEYREIRVGIWEGVDYPCLVQVGDGTQSMSDPSLGWDGNPIPRWNGWVADPLFDRPTAEAIIAACHADREAFGNDAADRFEWDGDTLLVYASPYEDEAIEAGEPFEPERIDPIIDPNGTPRWDIGGCSWCWSVEED
jgi:hypothetical protein